MPRYETFNYELPYTEWLWYLRLSPWPLSRCPTSRSPRRVGVQLSTPELGGAGDSLQRVPISLLLASVVLHPESGAVEHWKVRSSGRRSKHSRMVSSSSVPIQSMYNLIRQEP